MEDQSTEMSNIGKRAVLLIVFWTAMVWSSGGQRNCRPNEQLCKDGECILSSSFCDYKADCSDASDEDFTRGELCGWTIINNTSDTFLWTLSPSSIPLNFKLVLAGRGDQMGEKVTLVGPHIGPVGRACSLKIIYQTHTTNESFAHISVTLLERNRTRILRPLELGGNDNLQSRVADYVIPKCISDFQLAIEATGQNGSGIIEFHEVVFQFCSVDLPLETCPSHFFQCKDGQCILENDLCDFEPNCCDRSDETQALCQFLLRCDFESDACGWKISEDDQSWRAWERGNVSAVASAASFGLIGDHTLWSDDVTSGHFLFVQATDADILRTAALMYNLDRTVASQSVCRMRFWYNIGGYNLGKFSVFDSISDAELSTIDDVESTTTNGEWRRSSVVIVDNGRKQFTITLRAEGYNGTAGYIALDDVSFSSGCGNVTWTTTPVATTTRLSANQLATPASAVPERLPPRYCSFEKDSCGWQDDAIDGFDWVRGSGSTTNHIRYMAPLLDATRRIAAGHYMFVLENTDDGQLKSLRAPQLHSLNYYTNSSECKVQFQYYITGKLAGSIQLHVRYSEANDGPTQKIWSVSGDLGEKWNQVELAVGGGIDTVFSLLFIQRGTPFRYAGTVAIDEIRFHDCSLPSPSVHCDTSRGNFHCINSKICIENNQLCDVRQDCGDGSDESDNLCQQWEYKRYDFEAGFGDFYQGRNGVEDDFDWTRISGGTESFETGPTFDHTKGTIQGHYVFIEVSQRQYKEQAWLLLKPLSSNSTACSIRFFYHLLGKNIGRLSLLVRNYQNGPTRTLWTADKEIGNFWVREVIQLEESSTDFQIIFEGQVGHNWLGDAALDDISLTPGCYFADSSLPLPPTTVVPTAIISTTTHTEACPSGEFLCKESQQCINVSMVCDFREDCSDGSDEIRCVHDKCTFEDLPPRKLCNWKIEIQTDTGVVSPEAVYKWEIITAEKGTGLEGHHPDEDHTTQTPQGSFLFADGRPGSTSHHTNFTSTLISQTGPQCRLEFWYFMEGDASGTLNILYKIEDRLHELGLVDYASNENWAPVRIPVGSKSNFQIIIQSKRGSGYQGRVAIDDILFVNCEPPRKLRDCTAQEMTCANGYCIDNSRICDYADDCGDGSDELHCSQYPGRCDFEHGLCSNSWKPDPTARRQWLPKQGNTPSVGTGPDTDQTTKTSEGYFIYVEASIGLTGDSARISSYLIQGGVEGCKLRYWYSMNGRHIGHLDIIQRFSNDEDDFITLQTHVGHQGRYWLRGEVDLSRWEDAVTKRDYVVVLEGVVGDSYLADIALDSLSLTPECKRIGDGLPGSQPTKPPSTNNCTWEDELQCASGECYRPDQACNFVNDCSDETDENTCGSSCDFEVDFCGWENKIGELLSWVRTKGPTSVGGEIFITAAHHNTSGYYLVAREGRMAYYKGDRAQLLSATFPAANRSCSVSFWYMVSGKGPGTLTVIVQRSSGFKPMWQVKGDQGREWKEALVHIGHTTTEKFRVIFEAKRGRTREGVIAIDDVTYHDCRKECSTCRECIHYRYLCDGIQDCEDGTDEDEPYCVLHEGDCTFEDSLACGWNEDPLWVRMPYSRYNFTGIPNSRNAFFAIADFETNRKPAPGDVTTFKTQVFPASDGVCYVRFLYRMSSPPETRRGTTDDMGMLRVSTMNPDGQASLMWLKKGNQGEDWLRANILIGNIHNYSVLFEAIRGDGPEASIAIDEVTFTPECRFEKYPDYNTGQIVKNCDWTHFLCHATQICMPNEWRCDGVIDCPQPDNDETGCLQHTTAASTTDDPRKDYTTAPQTCGKHNFTCADGTCIAAIYYCDGAPDCSGGDDEYGCSELSLEIRHSAYKSMYNPILIPPDRNELLGHL